MPVIVVPRFSLLYHALPVKAAANPLHTCKLSCLISANRPPNLQKIGCRFVKKMLLYD
jgi:hypothetical protein